MDILRDIYEDIFEHICTEYEKIAPNLPKVIAIIYIIFYCNVALLKKSKKYVASLLDAH